MCKQHLINWILCLLTFYGIDIKFNFIEVPPFRENTAEYFSSFSERKIYKMEIKFSLGALPNHFHQLFILLYVCKISYFFRWIPRPFINRLQTKFILATFINFVLKRKKKSKFLKNKNKYIKLMSQEPFLAIEKDNGGWKEEVRKQKITCYD